MNILNKSIYTLIIMTLLCVFTVKLYALPSDSIFDNDNYPMIADELKDLLERKVLRVAMYKGNTWPFYFQREKKGGKGQLEGIDVEIIKGFARKLGLKVEFLRTDTIDGAVDMVADGKADLAICKLSITFSRASKVLFTKPYIKLRKGLLVNRVGLQLLQKKLGNLSQKETIQILAGNFCAMKNSPYAHAVNKQFKQVETKECPSLQKIGEKENALYVDFAYQEFTKIKIKQFKDWRMLGVIDNSSYVGFANQRFKQMVIREFPTWQNVIDGISSGALIAGFRDEAEIKRVIFEDKGLSVKLLTVILENDFDPKGIALPSNANYLKSLLDFYIDSLGLELTANSVIFDYDSVIAHLNRYNDEDKANAIK